MGRKGKDAAEGGGRKVSIHFFGDREVRAVWDDGAGKWRFSALDVVGAVNGEGDYAKTRNSWGCPPKNVSFCLSFSPDSLSEKLDDAPHRLPFSSSIPAKNPSQHFPFLGRQPHRKWLKAKLKRERPEVVSAATQLRFTAPDGKRRLSDAFDAEGVAALAKAIPNNRAGAFLDWFVYGPETLDEKSKKKAYALFESGLLDSIEVGTVRGLRQIHGYLFGGLYDFAGQIRTVNLAKDGFAFAPARFLEETLARIEAMPETDFGAIAAKYVEMNIAHPFREGNGRATRIWLDRMLAARLGACVDWSRVDKRAYLDAMRRSVSDASVLSGLLQNALTDRTGDRETFMKGIDYSYYYEEPEGGA